MANPCDYHSKVTLGEIEANPDRAYGPKDLASAGICRTYKTLYRWIENGDWPEPRRTPDGRMFWLGAQIAEAMKPRRAA